MTIADIIVRSGRIEGSGTVTAEPRFGAGGAPDFLIMHATEVFTDASGAGTFTIKRQVKVTPKGDPNTDEILTGTGTWVVIGGTGLYEELRGQGTAALTIDETQSPDQFTFIFTGRCISSSKWIRSRPRLSMTTPRPPALPSNRSPGGCFPPVTCS